MADRVAAVVVAAGRGLRAGGGLPKQYRRILGEPVIRPSLAAFSPHRGIFALQPVIHPDDGALFQEASKGFEFLPAVHGGATRQASVRAGLEALERHQPDIVLVHDAARPFASEGLIARAIAAAAASGAAVPVVAVADTVKTVDAAGGVTGTVDRAHLRLVQTPQAFGFAALLDAHRRAKAAGRDDFTDDAHIAEWAGLKVTTFEGETGNVKLTTNDDFVRAEAAMLAGLSDVRTGFGFDVHSFGAGDHVMLGGLRIPHGRGLAGHSDADVVLHALVDAVLGALAEGDIGVHFSPTDPRWRGASSDRFLAFAVERLRARGGRIAHLDVTIVCEAPRVGPHVEAMKAAIGGVCGISASRIAIKATTSEQLGFTGRREGIVAMASASIELPRED